MDKKEEYIRKLDIQLREWSAKIDELRAKADKMKDGARIKHSGLFETWDKEKEQVQKKIKELKEASGPAWEELKLGIENSWQEMKTGLDNARAKLKTTKAIPEDYHSVTPIFVFKDARKAIEFYKRAFGAQERYAMPGPDGKGVMHAALRIGNSIIMMGEENPQQPCKSAETIGGSPVSFYLYIENVDEAFRIALDAGAEARMPVQDMFWGDRVGTVQDPFGYSWMLATHIKDLTPQEIHEGAQAAFARTAKE